MGPRPGERFFFVHVMKTAGTTFARYLRRNFERNELYPGPWDEDRHSLHYNVDRLLAIPDKRLERTRVINGHFPYVASELLPVEFTRITILRDPVERTISHLKHAKREQEHFHDSALEAIYEDEFFFTSFVRDFQTKVFAFTKEDGRLSCLEPLQIDAVRLEVAKQHLTRIDILGLQERLMDLTDQVERRYGWSRAGAPNARISTEGWDVPASFRRRIAEDNPADQEFYEFACQLYEKRGALAAR